MMDFPSPHGAGDNWDAPDPFPGFARQLDLDARVALRDAHITATQWTRFHFGPDAVDWDGDRCGCPDPRCIGYHHDGGDDCGCLAVLIDQARQDYQAGAELAARVLRQQGHGDV